MRQIVLDTETTGLDWKSGDRVIEIGCVELLDRKLTGQHYHVFINPQRPVDPGAMAVHGLSNEFLADKPLFRDIVAGFEDFVADGELIIHNASFDLGFLNNELNLLKRPTLAALCPSVIDTLKLAKEQNPGKKASLNALCERHAIDNTHRSLHGALLDAELLADVYLAMTRGQESLIMALEELAPQADDSESGGFAERPPLRVLLASAVEVAEHDKVLADLGARCLWTAA